MKNFNLFDFISDIPFFLGKIYGIIITVLYKLNFISVPFVIIYFFDLDYLIETFSIENSLIIYTWLLWLAVILILTFLYIILFYIYIKKRWFFSLKINVMETVVAMISLPTLVSVYTHIVPRELWLNYLLWLIGIALLNDLRLSNEFHSPIYRD